MDTSRRKFFKQAGMGAGTVAILGTSTLEMGCWFSGDLEKQIAAYANIGLQAFQSVVDLLVGGGVIQPGQGQTIDAVIALVKAGFADIQTAVAAYENAPADQKQTALQKVSLAVQIAQENIQQFWNDLHIPDEKLSALIQGLLGIILSTLAGFAAQLPPPPPQAKKKSFAKTVAFSAKKRSEKEFKADFNKQLEAAGYKKAF